MNINVDVVSLFTIIEAVGTVIIAISTIFILLFIHRNEKKDSTTAKTIACLTELFTEYKKVMKKINKALKDSVELQEFLEDCKKKKDFSEFNTVYYSKKYNTFREVHYFFELIGTMINLREINKYTVWHYFSFPIEYFMETVNIRYLIINNYCLPSYAENFCLMFRLYDSSKKKNNKPWIANGKPFSMEKEKVDYYACGYVFKKQMYMELPRVKAGAW